MLKTLITPLQSCSRVPNWRVRVQVRVLNLQVRVRVPQKQRPSPLSISPKWRVRVQVRVLNLQVRVQVRVPQNGTRVGVRVLQLCSFVINPRIVSKFQKNQHQRQS